MVSLSKKLRQPIVVVLGHVDHGKTTLLDKIRGTAVVKKEAGEMTQHVGASNIPISVIEKVTEPLKKIIPLKLTIPGLLFIDTPGHELFSNLRKRGGSVADIAILVIDINEGVMPQTVESIEILKSRNVPFVIAANKIDKIPGWKPNPDTPITISLKKQDQATVKRLESLMYKLIAQLSNYDISADIFERIRDFMKTIPIVPVSARTGEGIAELLAVVAGMAQRYISEKLLYVEGPGKGVVLEVKEQPGFGTAIDVILYDGIIQERDTIILAGLNGPIVTKVRAILMPKTVTDIRVAKTELKTVELVSAAAGIRIVAPNLEDAVAGSPLYVVPQESEIDKYKRLVQEEVETVRFRKDVNGVVVKADTLGTLEAIINALSKRGISIRIADVGPLTKRDVIEASLVAKADKYLGVILLFNVKPLPEAEDLVKKENLRVFSNNIIYRLIEEYLQWVENEKKLELQKEFESLVSPGKIKILPGFIFRRSDPAIVGVEVLGGIIKPGVPLMKADGKRIGEIMQIQHMGQPIKEARMGQEVAISIKGNVMVGRHIHEGDILYTDIPLEHAKLLVTKFKAMLTQDSIDTLKEILKIKSYKDPEYMYILKNL
ncbi:translation initiation factor IF-2 [Ignisphaera sp. 4213-co]|uniref:Probable translation initiation factor IF-2 n=1 Tax=Ignisphaera cupida TaxID=3050454 RepID=A0ABD4Z5X6_9CREN|nr:translation initiation factor IF-2 [Ignisphaera sp. 4213-co]MDK6028565.1 translation initiation factor IF-2 [Ignisphaera sp. 4213-co]